MKALVKSTTIAVALVTGAPPGLSQGIGQTACDAAAMTLFKGALRMAGVPDLGIAANEAAIDASREFNQAKADEAPDAAARSLAESLVKAAIPGAGLAIDGGKLSVTGIKAFVEDSERQQVLAFVCAESRVFDIFAQPTVDFFARGDVQRTAPGINCHNFTDWITNYDKYQRLEQLWRGPFSAEVRSLRGRGTKTDAELKDGWSYISKQWGERWSESVYRGIRERIRRDAASLPQQCKVTKPLQPASFSEPRTAKGNFVDRCYAFASQCDDNNQTDPRFKPSANAFCKSKGYSGVAPGGSRWSYKAPTEIQSSGQLCTDAKGCGGLDYVSCQ